MGYSRFQRDLDREMLGDVGIDDSSSKKNKRTIMSNTISSTPNAASIACQSYQTNAISPRSTP